ncbi:MAG: hypothetical protein QF492_03920 [Candidatus Krumholzibacteria bacterium]|jgi:hypothetical protein|nr:hypothetical protein [Candidatus Krumholzibacteria bacterium]MDP6669045.1 hypothetical protein [Candidatus Krumholzibacteria bacterium]
MLRLGCILVLLLAGLASPDWIELDPVEGESPSVAPEREEPKQIDLPRRFVWKGKVRQLAPVGFIYLGDYYLIDELDSRMADLAWDRALEEWPASSQIHRRKDLAGIFQGKWQESASSLKLEPGRSLGKARQLDWNLGPDLPLDSRNPTDIPGLPTILYRLSLEALRQQDPGEDVDARAFLEARLLALSGKIREARQVLKDVEGEGEWFVQLVNLRGQLDDLSWNPERALAEFQILAEMGIESDYLRSRIQGLKRGLRPLPRSEGSKGEVRVRLLGRTREGRWALEAPDPLLKSLTSVHEASGASVPARLSYHSEEYWVISLPLGSSSGDWESGDVLTLTGRI